MVLLLLGDRRDPVDEVDAGHETLEREAAGQDLMPVGATTSGSAAQASLAQEASIACPRRCALEPRWRRASQEEIVELHSDRGLQALRPGKPARRPLLPGLRRVARCGTGQARTQTGLGALY